MVNPEETGLIFPAHGISLLMDVRGEMWQNLVAAVEKSEPDGNAQVAFILMMARLNNCVTCNSDSYRAMHGCITCARQSIKRFHGSDEDLTGIFETARTEVIEFLQKKNETNTPPSGFKKSSKGSYVPKNIY